MAMTRSTTAGINVSASATRRRVHMASLKQAQEDIRNKRAATAKPAEPAAKKAPSGKKAQKKKATK